VIRTARRPAGRRCNNQPGPAPVCFPRLSSSPAIGVTCSPVGRSGRRAHAAFMPRRRPSCLRPAADTSTRRCLRIIQMEAPVAPADRAARLDRRSAVLLKPFRPRTSHIVKLRSITVVHYDAYDFSAKGENRHPPTPPTSHTEDNL
jgi:hypothetical protein